MSRWRRRSPPSRSNPRDRSIGARPDRCCASPCVPAFRAGPLLVADAAAAEVPPGLDVRRSGQPIDGSLRATGMALRARRMACEPEVEEVVAHRVPAPLADNGRRVGGLAAATSEVCPNRRKGYATTAPRALFRCPRPWSRQASSYIEARHRIRKSMWRRGIRGFCGWRGSGGQLVSRLPGPRVRWSRLGDIRPNDCRSPPSTRMVSAPPL